MRTLEKKIILSTMFTIRFTVHTTTQHTPSQLVFGREAILDINQEANWQLIKQYQQVLTNKGNQKENHCRQSHVYHTRDKVVLKNVWKTKFNQDAYVGPYTVTEIGNKEQYAPVKATSQTLITCATSHFSKNRNDLYYEAVYHSQV